MKRFPLILAISLLCACNPRPEKEIVVSIPADGLWDRYPTPEAVCGLLDTIAWAGFNSIKVDVKPVVGYCEFESSYLEPMRTMKTRPGAHEDWDYAGVFLREGRRRGLKVSLTCAVFPMGAWQLDDGPAFRDPSKDGWFCVEYLPDGLRDIREDRRQGVFCFMNPSHPEVHDFVLGYIEELLAKYQPDGFQLDYCRYNNINCDFSDYSRRAFEQWLGRPVAAWPMDIFTFASSDPSDIVPGPLYKQWIKWRAGVIQGYVREVREIVDRVSPRTALRYWGAGWWHALYSTGQNWCSPSTAEPMDYPWAAEDYASTGIADLVDYFELGTYRPRVHGPEDSESMEFDLARARRLVGPRNIVYGSFSTGCDISEAFEFLYENADGVSFFPVDALRKDPALWEVFREAISPDFNALRNRIHLIALKESPEKAHAMFLKLADECHAKGEYALEAGALYEMSTNYLDQRDTLGMRRLLDRMERLSKEHPENTGAGYSYYSVLGTYYASLYEQDGSDATRDAMFKALREAIRYQERMTQRDYQQQAIVPAWNYYNVAVCYDLYCDPSVRDSIDKYLVLADKANRETLYLQPFEHQQIDVSIRDLRAWLLYYDGRVEEAIAEMNEVLALIDSVEASSPNTVITERGEAYGFFVEVYSSMGDYEKALEYERLKAENDAVRFSAQRNAAVREVEAKYDVAKVETRLAKVRGWAASLAILSLLLLSMVLYYRLLIRSKEESRYTAAVEALVETDANIRALTETVSPEAAKKVFSSAQIPLSAVERKYILLFMSGKSTEKIAEAMNVEPASVYTMKYRIKKKFPEGFPLPF